MYSCMHGIYGRMRDDMHNDTQTDMHNGMHSIRHNGTQQDYNGSH